MTQGRSERDKLFVQICAKNKKNTKKKRKEYIISIFVRFLSKCLFVRGTTEKTFRLSCKSKNNRNKKDSFENIRAKIYDEALSRKKINRCIYRGVLWYPYHAPYDFYFS